MHALADIAHYVNVSHSHLGELLAMSMVAVKARKCLLVIAPSGCGKTRVSDFMAASHPDSYSPDRLTIAGLKPYQELLSNYHGLVVVDDIASGYSQYTRLATISALTKLCSEHGIDSATATSHYRIENFYGSAIINCQPVLFRALVSSPEWEAQIQDKTIRYYHLYRPIKPRREFTPLVLDWGISIDEVEEPNPKALLYGALKDIVGAQWSITRVRDNLDDLLKATAALDGSKVVRQQDYKMLLKLVTPMKLERFCMIKEDFEYKRSLLVGLLYMLIEFVTYDRLTIRQFMDNYKINLRTAYRLLDKYKEYWIVVDKNPTTYAPSDELKRIIREVV